MSFIVCKNIAKRYGQGDSTVNAIDKIELVIENGEFVALMGESGAGKSTLLSILGAMNRPTTGRYVVDDIDVYGLTAEKRSDFRREYLGFVFQSFHLISYLTVLENVMLPLTTVKKSRQEKETMALDALARVGMDKKALRLPSQISGGELERTAIARAIVNHPPVVLADEPTGNLDSHNAQAVMELLGSLNQAGTTIIMVTHSMVSAGFAQRVLHVKDGRLLPDLMEPTLKRVRAG
jgi:putative ABC transport system ATP-binding protein